MVWVPLDAVAGPSVPGGGSGLLPRWCGRLRLGESVGSFVWVLLQLAVWLMLCTWLSVRWRFCDGLAVALPGGWWSLSAGNIAGGQGTWLVVRCLAGLAPGPWAPESGG